MGGENRISLALRQRAGAEVERRMLERLMTYGPADDLRVCEVKQIAEYARFIAFDAMTAEGEKEIEQ